MNALNDAGLLGGSVGPVSPVFNRTPRLERTVEGSDQSALNGDDQRGMFSSPAAVLELVESSAAQYAEILKLVDDDPTAGATTGYRDSATSDTGLQTDVYA
jgi:hypothetical protein